MSTSKHDAVWDWLMSCPHIKDLFFNFSQAEAENTAIIPSETVMEEYIDGSKLIQYEVSLVQFQTLSDEPNDEANVTSVEDFEKISEWIDAQVKLGNYPEFPDGSTIEEITTIPSAIGMMQMQDERLAKLMSQFIITYTKE